MKGFFGFRLLSLHIFLLVFSIVFSDLAADADTLKRGMVVGDQLDAEGIAVLKSWKVNIVRYSFIWASPDEADFADATSYAAWLDDSISKFDVILPLLQAQGIKVVLNLHTPPGGFSRRDSNPSHRVFEQQWAQDAFIAAWEKIATHYTSNPSIWAYDLLNEPSQAAVPPAPLLDWNALAQLTAEHIRVIDANTPIMMTPVYGKLTRLSQMKTLTVPAVLYTIHFYDPWRFIHQGIYGVKFGITYPSKDGNKEKFLKSLKALYTFQKKKKTQIFIGEFSVARWAPNKSGEKYLKDIVSIFQKYKFNWVYHSFRGSDIWDLEKTDVRKSLKQSPKPTGRLKAVKGGFSHNS